MKKGDILLVNFTGKETQDNKVFDSTSEKIAKDNGFFHEGHVYAPMTVVVGSGELITGLEEELEKMHVGEQRIVVIEPKKAFGERRKDLVFVVPLQEFRNRQIQPFPGLVVDLNGRYGKVQTVSGGRVRVDLNSDLAGKTVEYSITIERQLTDPKEQSLVLAEKFFPFKEKPTIKLNGEELEVNLPSNLPKNVQILKDAYSKFLTEHVKEVKKVKFIEEVKEKDAKGAEKAVEVHSHNDHNHEDHSHHDHDHSHAGHSH